MTDILEIIAYVIVVGCVFVLGILVGLPYKPTDRSKIVKHNNYERIKSMSIEEMAEMLAMEVPHGDCCNCLKCCNKECCDIMLKWLRSNQSFKDIHE